MYRNKLEGMMKKKSKWSKPSHVDNLNTTYRNVAEAHMDSQAHLRNADYIWYITNMLLLIFPWMKVDIFWQIIFNKIYHVKIIADWSTTTHFR